MPERLHPDDIEAIARRVVELLRPAVAQTELLTAAQVAERFGLTRTWVYDHAGELGAVRLGTGERGRLRFDPETVRAALTARSVRESEPAPPVVAPQRRRRAPQREGRPLLPIRDPDS